MTQALRGGQSAGGRGEFEAAARDVVCDAGITRTDGCLGRVEVPLDGRLVDVPDGWLAARDPWGRVSRFTGEPLILHLCPPCAAAQVPA